MIIDEAMFLDGRHGAPSEARGKKRLRLGEVELLMPKGHGSARAWVEIDADDLIPIEKCDLTSTILFSGRRY